MTLTTTPGQADSAQTATQTSSIVAARAVSRRVARRSRLNAALITALVSLLMIGLWELLADLFLSRLGVLASPSAIVRSLAADPALYADAVSATAGIAIRGWFCGSVAAIVVALLFVQVKAVESLFLRLALALFCLPLVAVNPLLQVTFDPDTAKVVLAAMSVFFFTLVSTILGLRAADGSPMTMVRAWGGLGWDALWFVRLPSGIPSILTGLQIGAPAAILGAVFGEFIGASTGIGVLLVNGLMSLDLGRVWAVAVLATVMSLIPYGILGMLRRWLTPWSASISSAAPVAASGSSLHRGARFGRALAWVAGSIVVILLAWYAYLGVFRLSSFVGKSPADVFTYLVTAPAAAENRDLIFGALGVTLLHSGVGYFAGLAVGVVAAVLFTLYPIAERVFSPLAIALRSMPIIVLTPVLILALGRGLWGVVAISAIVTFFPTLANTQSGLKRVPQDALVLMRSYDSTRPDALWRVQIPYTLPAIFASARLAAPTAVLASTLAEWLATGDGLGHVIVDSRAHSDYAGVWAAAAVLTAVSIVFYSLVSLAERAVLKRYAPSFTS